MMKNFLLFLLLSLVERKAAKQCDDWAELHKGEMKIVNNVWGKGSLNGEQCITSEGWSWNWPDNVLENHVISYPEIIYGHKPWDEITTTSRLPKKISELKHLKITTDYNFVSNGIYNVATETWLTSKLTSKPEDITHEIMIWYDHSHQMRPSGRKVKRNIRIDGEYYDLWYNPNHGKWIYLAFVSKKRMSDIRVTIDMKSFLKYLEKDPKYQIKSDSYLAVVEFGTEIIRGKGQMTIDRYSIDQN
ncbi:hypothetical protein SNEBB_001742 [Seison nebaliae]|nr:hypothetical protein SNEBB_001742 [Seison nebaliae]